MKKIILSLSLAMMAGIANSAILTPEEAVSRMRADVKAINAVSQMRADVNAVEQKRADVKASEASSLSAVRNVNGLSTADLKLAETYMAENQPAVYLFSRGENAGYLVLSADDMAESVLGYCDKGSLDVNNMPPALTYMLESYADQIAYARANAPKNTEANTHVSPQRAAIHPLCTTQWSQNAPFSDLCPNQYSTGCVATALAQVLKYFNYPTKGSGSMWYTWNDQVLTYDFDANTFKWDEMLDSYNGAATDAQKNAVAELMYACGVAVQMNYKSGGSGAYPIDGITNLVEHFGMDKSIRYCNRDYYGYDEWNDLVYDAVKNGGPVMLAGCIMYNSYVYSHEFVCDGYADDDLFHINWGWGGQYDGYFRLAALDIYANGYATTKYAYNYYQDALCYIKPAEEDSEVFEQVYCTNFNAQYTSAKLGNRQKFNNTLYNYSGAKLSGTAGVKFTDLEGNVVANIEGTTSFTDVDIASAIGGFYIYMPSDLAEGTYTMTPIYRGSDGEWHDVRCKMTACQSYTVTVSEGKAYFTEDGVATYSVSDFAVDTPIYNCQSRDIPFALSAKINCDEEYYGKISAAFYDAEGTKVTTLNYVPLYVPNGETLDFTFYDSVSGLTEGGTYKVALVDASGNAVSDMQDVTISKGRPSWTAQLSNIEVENSGAVDKHQITVHFDAECTSGYLYEQLNLSVYNSNKKSVASWPVYPVAVANGQKRTFTVHASMPDAEDGATYYFNIVSSMSGKVVSASSTYFTIADECSGVTDVAIDVASDESAECYTLQGVKVTGALAPGVYIKRSGGKVSKVIVK